MDADDVSRIIEDQTRASESLPNPHGIDLRQSLTKPTLIQVTDRRVEGGKFRDSTETVWLVLEERPARKDGYKIIFNAERGMFGLATPGFPDDPFPILCTYYRDFPTALASM